MTVAAFDIIPTDDLYATIFGLTNVDPPDALNSNFDIVGFETTWSFFNLGSLGLIIISFPVFIAVDLALRFLDAIKIDKVGKWQKKLAEKLYWNAFIRFVIESYTILTVCCLINTTSKNIEEDETKPPIWVSNLTWNTSGEIVMSSFAIIGAIFVILFPFGSSVFLKMNWEKIKNNDE